MGEYEEYPDFLMKRIKSFTNLSGWQEAYRKRIEFPRVYNIAIDEILKLIYEDVKKLRKERREEPISEGEFHRSIHEYAKNWPEDLRQRAKPILDTCPPPPEGQET